ncbi:MAG TPA: lamin tail domain-containing protein [Polyangiaceae bacterium]
MKRSLLVLVAGVLGACSTILGADFDDRPVRGEKKNTGGSQPTGGAAGNGSGGASAGNGAVGGGGSNAGGTGGQAGTEQGGAGGEGGGSGGTDPTGGTAGKGGAAGNGGSGAGGGSGGSAGGGEGGMGGEPEAGVVVLNEVKGQGDGDDYIEIYNRGPGVAAIGGFGIADENNTFVIPMGTTLAPDEYLLLLLGRSDVIGNFTCFTPNPCFHASWGVAQDGEMVFLRDAANSVIDTATYPDQAGPNGVENGESWGRFPDGTGSFTRTRLTPERENQEP